jgi:hypothetical protein
VIKHLASLSRLLQSGYALSKKKGNYTEQLTKIPGFIGSFNIDGVGDVSDAPAGQEGHLLVEGTWKVVHGPPCTFMSGWEQCDPTRPLYTVLFFFAGHKQIKFFREDPTETVEQWIPEAVVHEALTS